jgi:hypothetical protein
MINGNYHVKTDNYTFDVSVAKFDSMYTLDFGSIAHKRGACIYMEYNPKLQIIKLLSMQHKSRCSSNIKLPTRHGTREILKAALKTSLYLFPEIKKVVLNDVSSIDCDGIKGKHMFLCYYYMLIHGHTWYEQFGAKPTDKDVKRRVEEFKDLLKSRPEKGVFEFYKNENNATTQFESWHEYFASKRDCNFYMKNKDEFQRVSKTHLVYSEWYIRSRDVKNYDVTINVTKASNQSIVVQGGGFTSWPFIQSIKI